MSSALLKQFRRIGWTASRRAVPRVPRINPRERERAIEAFDDGEYELALEILERNAAALVEDPGCLNLKAMASVAVGRPDEDVDEILDEAERSAKRLLAGVHVNRAAVQKSRRRYEEALEAGTRALSLSPEWYAPHLALISILEHRNEDGDRSRVIAAAQRMRKCPGWKDGLDDLDTDVEFERLRNEADGALFERLFGRPPSSTNRQEATT